ncbi:MAG: hypothetical protein HFG49_15605 [Lachnospiraceae bacterium]|jgi:hypothetical protein|nr:hypothetical protein [Lachnospiraceae bacterium]
MFWYNNLYTGKTAEKKRFSIIQKIRSGSIPAKAYVIVPASNRKNLLDIWEASQACTSEAEERRKKAGEELLILGIAWGYEEALELAGQMINEVYQATGDFDIRSYFRVEEYQTCPEVMEPGQ